MRGMHGSDCGKCSPSINVSWLKQSTGKPNVGRTNRFSFSWILRHVGVGKLVGVVWKETKWWSENKNTEIMEGLWLLV